MRTKATTSRAVRALTVLRAIGIINIIQALVFAVGLWLATADAITAGTLFAFLGLLVSVSSISCGFAQLRDRV